MNGKEYQSAAAVEGMANFYSALAFNMDSQTDCMIQKHYYIDWNRNGSDKDLVDVRIFSCEDGVSVAGLDSYDYAGDHCIASGETNNRGTEYDWLRLFWDLRTDNGWTLATIFNVWDLADPHSWNKNGNGTGGGYPAERMHDAAVSLGLEADYDGEAMINGASR